MILSILAGMMIGLGAIVYLSVGEIAGAFMFSLGLLTILHYKFALFTGKAGGLATGAISPKGLAQIYLGNAFGTCIIAFIVQAVSRFGPLVSQAQRIVETRTANFWYENLLLGVLCGILMFIAVGSYEKIPILTMMCVATFILIGANHCVADMFYFWVGAADETVLLGLVALVWTSLGNIIGCNIIPFCQKYTSL